MITFKDIGKMGRCIVAHNGFKLGQRRRIDYYMAHSAPEWWEVINPDSKPRRKVSLTDL